MAIQLDLKVQVAAVVLVVLVKMIQEMEKVEQVFNFLQPLEILLLFMVVQVQLRHQRHKVIAPLEPTGLLVAVDLAATLAVEEVRREALAEMHLVLALGLEVVKELPSQEEVDTEEKTPAVAVVEQVEVLLNLLEFKVVKVVLELLWLLIQLKTLYKVSIDPLGDPWRVL